MKVENIKEAIAEAECFLRRARAVIQLKEHGMPNHPYITTDGKTAAACKRASMDLTRSLAKMRYDR